MFDQMVATADYSYFSRLLKARNLQVLQDLQRNRKVSGQGLWQETLKILTRQKTED